MHPLAYHRLRAGHLARDLRIRALVEDARADGIALRHWQLGEQRVQATGVPERRELLHPLEVAVLKDHRLVAEPRASGALDLARRALSSSLCSAISNSQPAGEPRSGSNRCRSATIAANVSAVRSNASSRERVRRR